jgi:hypothetical protein
MTLKEATMAGQDNLHIVREIFAAWNAHDVEGLVKRLDTKTTWKSDAFPAPFSGHKGDSAVPSSSTSRRFPIFTLTSSRSSPPTTVMWWAAGALREPTTVGTVLLGSAGDDQRRLGRVEDRGPWHCSWSHARYREVSEMAKLMESLRLLLARIRRLIVGGR